MEVEVEPVHERLAEVLADHGRQRGRKGKGFPLFPEGDDSQGGIPRELVGGDAGGFFEDGEVVVGEHGAEGFAVVVAAALAVADEEQAAGFGCVGDEQGLDELGNMHEQNGRLVAGLHDKVVVPAFGDDAGGEGGGDR